MTLTEVALALSPGTSREELPEPVAWLEYELSDDVIVRVQSGLAPWRHKMIRKVLAEAAAKLKNEQKEKETE